jgi:hypothetical protein
MNYESSNFLINFPLCKELLQKHYNVHSSISLKKYKLDPFFSDNENLQNLYEWYKTKNPEFKPMNIINPKMPEYEVLISGMIKDIYLSLINEKEKNEILNELEKIIRDGYLYKDIINCIYNYLILFDSMLNNNSYRKDCNLLLDLLASPYIIYPSFHQIDIYKVNLTISAPFLNFLLSNNTHKSHSSSVTPCYELYHDIDFHYNFMTMQFFKDLFNIRNKNKNNNNNNNINYLIKNINKNINLFIIYFNFNNSIIQKLKDKLIFKRTKNNSFNTYKTKENYMNSIIFFLIFHEDYFYKRLFELSSYHIKLTENSQEKFEKNFEEILKQYFKESFYKICIDNLFTGNINNIKTYIYNSNTDILKIIKPEFKEVIESNYKIELTSDNINEIIKLYKASTIDIYNTLFD